MKIKLVFVIPFLAVILLCNSCKEKTELTHPKIFNDLTLGMDYDSAINIVNMSCLNDIGLFNAITYQIDNDNWPISMGPIESGVACEFKITDEIFAEPNLLYASFNGKKVLGSATLLFHSPSSFPYIEIMEFDQSKRQYIGMPALTDYEADKIVEFYDARYGKRKKNSFRANYTWETDGMIISMYKDRYEDLFLENVLTPFAFRVVVTYRYNQEKLNLLELEKKTKSGESVGSRV